MCGGFITTMIPLLGNHIGEGGLENAKKRWQSDDVRVSEQVIQEAFNILKRSLDHEIQTTDDTYAT